MSLSQDQRAANAAEYIRRLLVGELPGQSPGPRAEAPAPRPSMTEDEVRVRYFAIIAKDNAKATPTKARPKTLPKSTVRPLLSPSPEVPKMSVPSISESLAKLRSIANDPSAPQHIRLEAQRAIDEATRPALSFAQEQALARLDAKLPGFGASSVATHTGAHMELNPVSEGVAASRVREMLAQGHKPIATGNVESLLRRLDSKPTGGR